MSTDSQTWSDLLSADQRTVTSGSFHGYISLLLIWITTSGRRQHLVVINKGILGVAASLPRCPGRDPDIPHSLLPWTTTLAPPHYQGGSSILWGTTNLCFDMFNKQTLLIIRKKPESNAGRRRDQRWWREWRLFQQLCSYTGPSLPPEARHCSRDARTNGSARDDMHGFPEEMSTLANVS